LGYSVEELFIAVENGFLERISTLLGNEQQIRYNVELNHADDKQGLNLPLIVVVGILVNPN